MWGYQWALKEKHKLLEVAAKAKPAVSNELAIIYRQISFWCNRKAKPFTVSEEGL